MTLAEIAIRMRPYWPKSFTNRLYPKDRTNSHCNTCGSDRLHRRGITVYQRKLQQNYGCLHCGSRANYRPL
jgi:transposase-like protein